MTDCTLSDLLVIDPEPYRQRLILWGEDHFRDFPWRQTRDPYHLLIAELLLHRTQARQVVEIYRRFIARYPDLASLRQATFADLRQELYSLGLNWRIALILHLAADLHHRFDGRIPLDRDDLLSLPGVGDYIASSLRCFSAGLPDAIIDTNVMRVITRLFAIPFRDSLRRNRQFRELTWRLVDPHRPRDYNFALLDLANLVCKPGLPDCLLCPLNDICCYARSWTAGQVIAAA